MTSKNPAQGRHQITIGVTTLAWLNLYQNLKQTIQDAIAPELHGIKGEMKALSQHINNLDDRLRQSEARVEKRFDAVDKRFDAMDRRLDVMGRHWETAMEIRERLVALEARLPRQ